MEMGTVSHRICRDSDPLFFWVAERLAGTKKAGQSFQFQLQVAKGAFPKTQIIPERKMHI